MDTMRVEAAVVGAGPGGYAAAIRLGQLGKRTVVVEREEVGGVCLNVGCIPSKALITAAKAFHKVQHGSAMGILAEGARLDWARTQAWKGEIVGKLTLGVRQLIKASGTELVQGEAKLVAPRELVVASPRGELRIAADAIVLAAGSRPIELPGFAVDQQRILDSTAALALPRVPSRLAVVGGGYIGLELGLLYAKLGAKVSIVEFTPTLLPGTDPELVQVVARKMKKLGVEVLLEAKAKAWQAQGDAAELRVETQGGERTIECDHVLITVGRRPNSDRMGLEAAGVRIDGKGFIAVDKQQRTSVPSIFAIGDLTGPPMLAHKAAKEAEVVADVIAGKPAEMDVAAIPAIVFTDPEIATVGLTQSEAVAGGRAVKVGKYPFGGLGRAMTQLETDGFVKIVADAASDELLGVHIVGSGASDLISEGALALEMGAFLHDLALTVHPHPTLGEAVMEAAKAALGESVHLVGGGRREPRS